MKNHDAIDQERRMMLDLDDGHVHMHVAAALIFDAATLRSEGGGIDIDAIRRRVAANLYLIPHAQQRILVTPIEGRPVWVDDRSFNLQYHVRHTHLPLPGDDRQLKRLCGQIASQELDREKPLWELWVVEGVSEDRFAIIAKAHQCMTGGVWSFDLVDRLLSEVPEEVPQELPIWYPRPRPSDGELLASALRRRIGAPIAAIQRSIDSAGEGLPERLRAALRGVFDAGESSETALNQPIGPHRRIDWMTFDEATVTDLANRSASSPDAVITSAIAGAVGSFLERRGTPIVQQQEMTIRVCEPANAGGLRAPEDRASALSWTVAELPIADVDPVQRLQDTANALEEADSISYGLFLEASEFLPGLSGVIARRQLALRASNLTLTRLTGPKEPLYLLKAPLLEIFPVMPLVPRQALRVAVLCYQGRLHWGFNSDWDQVPDLHDLVQATSNGLEELGKAIGSEGARA